MFVCVFWFNIVFNKISVTSRRCLVATESSMLTFIVLPHWSIMLQTHLAGYPLEPEHEQNHEYPTKTQISLRICTDWSISAVNRKKPSVLDYPIRAQPRLWSDCKDVQADLSLCRAQMYFISFLVLIFCFNIIWKFLLWADDGRIVWWFYIFLKIQTPEKLLQLS